MVIFEERYPISEDVSDTISDEDYAESVKRQIQRVHHHKDGSPVHLQMVQAAKQQRAVRQLQQEETEQVRRHQPEKIVEQIEKPKKQLAFDCGCGKTLVAEQKGNSLNVAYLDASDVEVAGYDSSRGNVEYGSSEGTVQYAQDDTNVSYGGK